MKKDHSLEDELYKMGIWFLIIGTVFLFVYFRLILPNVKTPPCIAYTMFGIYCPGCGGTRSLIALCHGEILTSIWYHPVVPYAAVLFAVFMLTHTLEKISVLHAKNMHANSLHVKGIKFHNWYLYVAVILLVMNVVIKNVLKFCFGIVM